MGRSARVSKGMGQKSSLPALGKAKGKKPGMAAGVNTMEQAPDPMSDYARMVAAGGA